MNPNEDAARHAAKMVELFIRHGGAIAYSPPPGVDDVACAAVVRSNEAISWRDAARTIGGLLGCACDLSATTRASLGVPDEAWIQILTIAAAMATEGDISRESRVLWPIVNKDGDDNL